MPRSFDTKRIKVISLCAIECFTVTTLLSFNGILQLYFFMCNNTVDTLCYICFLHISQIYNEQGTQFHLSCQLKHLKVC